MGCGSSKPKGPADPLILGIDHFEVHRVLGKGAFGKVQVAFRKCDQKIYAIKQMEKMQMVEKNAVQLTLDELEFMKTLDSRFISTVRAAFHDDFYCYLVQDIFLGGSLGFHLGQTGKFKEDVVVRMAADILGGLEYLISQRVVHRDLKPDNLVIDTEGHVGLIDFNVSQRIPEGETIHSCAGTLIYMAPEVLAKKEYTFEPDVFSLGMVLYELLTGKRGPFKMKEVELTQSKKQKKEGKKEDQSKEDKGLDYKNRHSFPSSCSSSLKNLLDGMLKLDTAERLTTAQCIEHDWFKEHNIDFAKVRTGELKGRFIPNTSKANIDPSEDMAEALGATDKPKRSMIRNMDFENFLFNIYVDPATGALCNTPPEGTPSTSAKVAPE